MEIKKKVNEMNVMSAAGGASEDRPCLSGAGTRSLELPITAAGRTTVSVYFDAEGAELDRDGKNQNQNKKKQKNTNTHTNTKQTRRHKIEIPELDLCGLGTFLAARVMKRG